MLTVLECFHRRFDKRIAVEINQCAREVGWEYPPVEEALEVA